MLHADLHEHTQHLLHGIFTLTMSCKSMCNQYQSLVSFSFFILCIFFFFHFAFSHMCLNTGFSIIAGVLFSLQNTKSPKHKKRLLRLYSETFHCKNVFQIECCELWKLLLACVPVCMCVALSMPAFTLQIFSK